MEEVKSLSELGGIEAAKTHLKYWRKVGPTDDLSDYFAALIKRVEELERELEAPDDNEKEFWDHDKALHTELTKLGIPESKYGLLNCRDGSLARIGNYVETTKAKLQRYRELAERVERYQGGHGLGPGMGDLKAVARELLKEETSGATQG